ncbi:MAG: DUF3450 family protein [Planctomycetes bacterium]|nr:DUF3450 family protein [Planctomycetota bacterium]
MSMKPKTNKTILFTLVCVFAASFLLNPLPISAAEPDNTIWNIHDKIEKSHALRAAATAERQVLRDEVNQVKRQVEQLTLDKQRLTLEIEKLKNRQSELSSQLSQKKIHFQESRQSLNRTAKHALGLVGNLQKRIGSGIAYQKQNRLGKLEAISRDLEDPSAAPKANALSELSKFVDQEFQLARSVQIWNAPVKLPDEREKHAWLYRMGLVNQALVTEDGEHHAIADRSGAKSWVFDLTAEQVEQLTVALNVLQRRKEPQITLLPFQLQIQTEELSAGK